MRDWKASKVKSHTLPIPAIVNGRMTVDGSGVLIELRNNFYLVTAEHVVQNNTITLEVGSPLSASDFGTFIRISDADIIIYQVKNPQAFINDGRLAFVANDEIVLGESGHFTHDTHDYWVCGYPSSKSKRLWGNSSKVEAWPFGFMTRQMSHDEYCNYPFDPRFHLIVHFREDLIVNGKTKQRQNPPNLEGISGGGVWRVQDDRISLAGIITEKYPRQRPTSIVSTRIDVVTEVIRRTWDLSIQASPLFPN